MNIPVIPPWVKPLAALLAGIALAAAAAGAIYTYGEHQFGLGETTERAAWLKRENTELTAANALIKKQEDQARATEREHALALAGVSAQYQEDLKHEKTKADRVIGDLRRGALRLRIPATCPDAARDGGAAATGAGSGGRDGETRAELSGAAAEFLVGLASEADAIVLQLTACQGVIAADRKQQGD